MMLFLADVRVKANRKILLCKRSGGDGEIRTGRPPPNAQDMPCAFCVTMWLIPHG